MLDVTPSTCSLFLTTTKGKGCVSHLGVSNQLLLDLVIPVDRSVKYFSYPGRRAAIYGTSSYIIFVISRYWIVPASARTILSLVFQCCSSRLSDRLDSGLRGSSVQWIRMQITKTPSGATVI